jgi:3-deoxy-D-manno-octulosonate 8-phosphate phosphatase (KDO 8-P phosphatase)
LEAGVTAEPDFSRIKAIALDVDGVLTDGGFWWGPNGEEWKRFCFADVMGISLGRKAGLIFALISGEASPLADRFAAKMGITDVFKGCKDKAAALREFAARHALDLTAIAFMGDDVNDLGAMAIAGLSAAPANAVTEVRDNVAFVAQCSGGSGAVREMLRRVLESRAEHVGVR